MKNILITGASGNVGSAILNNIVENANYKIWKASYADELKSDELYFDFNNLEKTKGSLENLDVLFLLRPPNIADTKTYFAPLIQACIEKNVRHIVFLSVQGAEKSSIIPHNKIEKLILKSGIPYTFIRPSYFMQNLTTTLRDNIAKQGLIFLPAGKAKFLWVDVNDIGKAIAAVLRNPEAHQKKVYVITGVEHFTFAEVAAMITTIIDKRITYQSPTLLHFFNQKKREGVATAYIFVLIMLHYLARFEKVPEISGDFTLLTNEPPNLLKNFIQQNKGQWFS